MALKDDARSVANDASALLSDLHTASDTLTKLVNRASAIAELIPTPDQAKPKLPWSRDDMRSVIARIVERTTDPVYADPGDLATEITEALLAGPLAQAQTSERRTFQVPEGFKLVKVNPGQVPTDSDCEALADDAERFTLMPTGVKVGRRDRNGKKLRAGDHVRVFDSQRYGNPTGVVRGPGPDLGDGKPRVLITLDDGRDDRYTPSAGRVERIHRVRDAAANEAINATADALRAHSDALRSRSAGRSLHNGGSITAVRNVYGPLAG